MEHKFSRSDVFEISINEKKVSMFVLTRDDEEGMEFIAGTIGRDLVYKIKIKPLLNLTDEKIQG